MTKLKYIYWLIFLSSFLWSQVDSRYSVISVGNFEYWQKDDGYSAHMPNGNSGGVYPAQTASTIYLDGILIGGFSNDGILKVSGTIYRNGMVSGYIDNDQLVQNDATRIYRIRKNFTSLPDNELHEDVMISFSKSDTVIEYTNAGIIAIEEYASWPSAETLVDGGVDSHLNPSLSQTGMILDNRAGGINLPSYARDYDRYDYWGFDDVVIDFSDSSLTWEYYDNYLHVDSNGDAVYQPFAAYRIEPFGGDTFRLFAGFWDSNGDGKWSVNYDEADSSFDWLAPTYGAECWEPIYCVQGYDTLGNAISYDPADEALYITTGAGIDEDGDGYIDYDALNILANSTWGSATGEFKYPYITAMLFSAYYGPNEAGSYVEGTATDGGSAALPIVGNYDKYGTQLTASHYFRFTTSNDSTTYIDSSGIVTDEDIQNLQQRYLYDWLNWPTDLGAPFYDLDGDGVYEPEAGESPGYAGADQVIWYVITDADVGTTSALYGCTPIGIEMQVTVFSYDQSEAALGQSVFKRVRLINKGSNELTDAYVSLWSDPDVGDYTNDLVGIDTLQEMMFAYNGVADDDDYAAYGLAPGSVGYKLIHGPVVESETDTAIVNFQTRPGFRNLPASSFGYFVAGGVWSDPGPYGDTEAAREYYNLMRGYAPTDDLDNPTPWVDNTGAETLFPYAGDPVTGEGDLDSGPSDRRMLINSGPFNLAVGDTQEFLFSVSGGLSHTYLTSIMQLKDNVSEVENYFNSIIDSALTGNTTYEYITWYPGDTDHNGLVDENDIISIGMYFHETTTTTGTGSFTWSPRLSLSGLSINNFLMADVSDDGMIDERDVVGIGVNWGNTYTVEGSSRSLWDDLDIYNLSDEQKTGFKKLYNSLVGDSEPVKAMRTLLKTILGIGLPSEFSLQQNYPNPFNAGTTLRFALPKPAVVNLSVYNVIGQVVDIPINNISYVPGQHSIPYKNNLLSSGVYFLRMDTGEWSSIKKIMLLK